jgi:hypothetical protein
MMPKTFTFKFLTKSRRFARNTESQIKTRRHGRGDWKVGVPS